MVDPVQRRFVKEYRNSTVYYEEGETEGDLKITTNTRRRVRVPGTEDLQDNYTHWRVFDESSTNSVTQAPSSYRATPSWASAIDDFVRDEDHPMCIRSTSCRCHCNCTASRTSQHSAAHIRRLATPGPSRSGTQGRTNRSLRQASILPYLISHPLRTVQRALSPGSHISHPIIVPDNTPAKENNTNRAHREPRDNRDHTRRETRDIGLIVFQAGTVLFALAPRVHPTMVAVVQYPVPQPGLQLEFNPSTKRRYDEDVAAGVIDEDVFGTKAQPVEHSPVASGSTMRYAIPTSSGHKRRCVETLNGQMSPSPTATTVSTPASSPSPALSLTPSSGSLTPTPSSIASATWKGKGRAL